MKHLWPLLLVAIITSCAKLNVTIQSNPSKADIFILDPETGLYKKIGQTPMEITPDTELPPGVKDSKVWGFSIQKDGHVVEHILFDRSINARFKISTKLKPFAEWIEKSDTVYADLMDRIGRSMQVVYSYIHAAKYSEALKSIEKLIENYPRAAIFYDIKGSIHLLRNEKDKAIVSYQKSLLLRPESLETKQVLEKLKSGKDLSR